VKFDFDGWMLAKRALFPMMVVMGLTVVAFTGCKKARLDPFPASNAVAGWQKTSETRVFAVKDLWQYIDGDSEQYISAGVVFYVNLGFQISGPVGGHGRRLYDGRRSGSAQDS